MASTRNKCLVIVGSGRSGTSWLSETMARTFRYRLLFEPDQDHQIKEGAVLTDKYFVPGQQYHEADAYLEKVFRNKIDSDWIGQNSNRKFKMHLWPILAKKHIIKFVRLNLGGLYIKERFQMPVVHIVRDPYSVIYSQKRVMFPWLFDFSNFTAQDQLVTEIQERYGVDIKAEYSQMQQLAIRWAIENIFTIEHQDHYTDKVDVYKQENLAANMSLFLEICEKYNLEAPENLEEIYQKPSSKTHPNSAIRANKKSDYSNSLTADEKREINEILHKFRMTIYPFQD